ncbi:MAG: DNA polymerase Y family protein [Rhodospirillales bacterium]
MRRVVSLYLPTWPSDRLRRQMGDAAPPPERPLVIAGSDDRRRVVVAADGAAQRLGVRPGLALAQARARVPTLQVAPADPVADAAALEHLALWALRRYSPVVAIDPPDGLLIDVTGVSHLFGGEAALLDDLRARLTAVHLHARVGLADTLGAAHALARYGAQPITIAAPGEVSVAVAGLPLAALRLDPHLAERLRRLGFETIADLAATPRAPLALRFGAEPGRRLDQLFGRLGEPIQPLRPPELVEVRRAFAEPIGAPETLARHIGRLVEALCPLLEAQGLGARRLDLLFHRVDNIVQPIRIGTAKPVRDVKRLTRLLTDRLETIDPGFGIEAMSLTAVLAEPLVYRQGDTLSREAAADVSALVDILANRIGAHKLYRAAPVESDLPERSVKTVAPLDPPAGATWPEPWPRPSRLLSPPEPIETLALLPDQPPVHFTWRGVRRRVKRADGPERVFGEWWRRDAEAAAVRDYFVVEDEAGERFWLFRSGDGEDPGTGDLRWYIHGVFA